MQRLRQARVLFVLSCCLLRTNLDYRGRTFHEVKRFSERWWEIVHISSPAKFACRENLLQNVCGRERESGGKAWGPMLQNKLAWNYKTFQDLLWPDLTWPDGSIGRITIKIWLICYKTDWPWNYKTFQDLGCWQLLWLDLSLPDVLVRITKQIWLIGTSAKTKKVFPVSTVSFETLEWA